MWPEHPSFADQGNLPAPPPKADATPRACNFGDNPLTPATDPSSATTSSSAASRSCDTYNAGRGRARRSDTARDSNGHGTHTDLTAAGKSSRSRDRSRRRARPHPGMAPGAWVIEYKVCGAEGCFGSDSAAAVRQAILDGVKVINFSISRRHRPV